MNVRNMNPSSLKIELDVTIVIEDDRSACAIRLAVRSQSLPGYVNLGVRTLVVHFFYPDWTIFWIFFDIFCTSPGCRVFFTVRNFQYVWRWYHDIISRAKGDCYYNHCFSAAVCQGWHVRERRQGSGGRLYINWNFSRLLPLLHESELQFGGPRYCHPYWLLGSSWSMGIYIYIYSIAYIWRCLEHLYSYHGL